MDTERARSLGEEAGQADAERYRECPEDFEETDDPFGMDSEPDLHQTWAEAYENAFEASK